MLHCLIEFSVKLKQKDLMCAKRGEIEIPIVIFHIFVMTEELGTQCSGKVFPKGETQRMEKRKEYSLSPLVQSLPGDLNYKQIKKPFLSSVLFRPFLALRSPFLDIFDQILGLFALKVVFHIVPLLKMSIKMCGPILKAKRKVLFLMQKS